MFEMLQASTWGRALTEDQLERVACEAREQQVPAGGYAAHAGTVVDHWSGVIEGLLKMSVTAPDGRVTTLAGVNGEGWYGEGSLLKREPRRYDVIALRPSRLVQVPQSTFEWLRHHSLPFNHYLQHLMNARLSLFIGMLQVDRLLSAEERVAHCLSTLFNTDLYPNPRQHVDLSQQEIGLLSGLSRQRANIVLGVLQERGLLRIEARGGITVLDIEGLRRYAAGR
ncbi:Crp/Fnr family transcriptional regulator [Caldimonas sp. KR1-144]|uniref:Crp/Fnr family transcriptional regulator n=1 Tax=Caldimonas sp. KR1-144 TaxID=3400911 RepID=UPI003BFDDB2A